MLYQMHQQIIHDHVIIAAFHAVAIFFDQPIVPLNFGSRGFEFIDITLLKILEQPQLS